MGVVWDGLVRLLGALGLLLAGFGRCFSKMVPWRAPGSILEPAGPILEASSHDFGGSGRALGLIFCMIFDRKRCNDLYLFCK